MMNVRNFASAGLLGLASLTVAIAPANAAACRGPTGRFIKCDTSAALPAKTAAPRTAMTTSAKPRAMAQAAAPARVQTATATHRAVPKTVLFPVKATATPAKTAAVNAKTAKAIKPGTTVAPRKG
jgi:hypothetical protein